MITLGIDEVGRGCWAGPLVAAAVALDSPIDGLRDSKKLSKKRRETLDVIIRDNAVGYGIGWVSATEVDALGLTKAVQLAMLRAVKQVQCEYDEVIIDGNINYFANVRGLRTSVVKAVVRADDSCPAASAASIIAKVARDNQMATLSKKYPGYGFEKHVGYGTAAHAKALAMQGVTDIHRLSFAPVKQLRVTNYSNGHHAEVVAAQYLEKRGYHVVECNWRHRRAEIDIVAEKKAAFGLRKYLTFFEVKYRKTAAQGHGLDYITDKKLHQMQFAAELYVAEHAYSGEYTLGAVEVSGETYDITHCIEAIV